MLQLRLSQLPIRRRVLGLLLFSIMAAAASLAVPAHAKPPDCRAACDRKYDCCLAGCQWWNIFCRVACGDDVGGLTYCYTNCDHGIYPDVPQNCPES
jgi:hypothetical protein